MSARQTAIHRVARWFGAGSTSRRGAMLVVAASMAAVGGLGAVQLASAAPTCTRTWDGGAGSASWGDAANWDGAGDGELPTTTDHVCIPVGAVVDHDSGDDTILSLQSDGALTLSDGSLSITDTTNASRTAALIQSGGALGGAGTLTILGAFEWTAGEQRGAGTTVISDAATATLGEPFSSLVLRAGRTLANDGTATWVDGSITLFGSAPSALTSIQNRGTFVVESDEPIAETFGNAGELTEPVFMNTGDVVKSAGVGTTNFLLPVDNDGTLSAEIGTIALRNGGNGGATGTFGSAAAGLIEFAGGTFDLADGAAVAGDVVLTFATVNLGADVAADGGTFRQTGGVLGGSGTLSILDAFEWTGGEQREAGTTLIADGATATLGVESSNLVLRAERTLANDGTITWADGSITLFGSAPGTRTSIQNRGTFVAESEGSISQTFGNVGELTEPVFANSGEVVKSAGVDTTNFILPVDNDGTLVAESGTIALRSGGDGGATGTFGTAGAGLVEFAGGTFELADGATLAGDVLLSFATLTLSADVTADVGSFKQSGGILNGLGTLTVFGAFEWTGGEQSDEGRTVIAEDATATIGVEFGGVTLHRGRTFENQGTVTWADGFITLFQSATPTPVQIVNSGTFHITDGDQLGATCCDGPVFGFVPAQFHNTGTISKDGGSGTSVISVPFVNDGTVDVSAATLGIRGVFENFDAATRTLEGGTWRISATLEFDGADIVTNEATIVLDGPNARIEDESGANGLRRIARNALGGELSLVRGADLLTSVPFTNDGSLSVGPDSAFTATGNFEQADGTSTVEAATSQVVATGAQVRVTGGLLAGLGSAGPSVVVDGGTVSPGLSPGTIHVAGAYAQAADGALRVELAGSGPGEFDVLAATGTAQVGGTLEIELIDDFVPAAGDMFRIVTSAGRSGEFASLLGTDLGSGVALTAQYDATGVTLVVSNQSISIDDVTLTEGDAGTSTATFTVTLAQPSTDTITVDYSTADDTAADPADYAGTSGSLTFDPGEAEQTVTVQVAGDTLDEIDESFLVDLTNPVNAPLAKSEGIGTIVDDDPLPSVSIAATDATVPEGASGTSDATFTVSLSTASGRPVSVGFATAPGTATSPADFAAKSGTVTFAAGETSKSITVSVKGDTLVEPDETFFVDLATPTNATLGTARSAGTIVDDDIIGISVANVAVDEGDAGTTDAAFVVTLSAVSADTVTVDYATADDSATAPADYLPASGTISWAPGEISKTVTIKIVGDTVPEATERFFLELTNPTHAVVLDGSATATIADGADEAGTPDFQLLISPSMQVLPPGGSAQYAVRAIGVFGFDDPVTLSTPDLPAGITASWSVNPLTLPGTSILTLTAAPGVSLGEQGFIVRGTGGGLTNEIRGNTTLDFGLIPICYGTIEGYVTDAETGAPIEDALITAVPLVKTDANGFYRIEHVALDELNNPIPDYQVFAAKDQYWTAQEKGVVVCDFVTSIDLELLRWRPASLEGTIVEGTPDPVDPSVVHPSATPIEGASVEIFDRAFDLSGADGEFLLNLPKLDPGNEPLVDPQLDVVADGFWGRPNDPAGGPNFSSPFPLGTIHPDEHRTGLVVPLVRKCTGTVSGVVTDAVTGLAIANADVDVLEPIASLDIKTDSSGHFTYPGVLLGYNNTPLERLAFVSAPGYDGGSAKFPMNACGDSRNVEIALKLSAPPIFGTLIGHVYDAETKLPLAGASIHTPICALPPGTTCTGTDANGAYRLQNVPLPVADRPVDVLFFSVLAPDYYLAADSFEMTANETTEHDFFLVPKKYVKLTGVVTDRFTGEPIAGASGSVSGLEVGPSTNASGQYLTGRIELPPYGEPTALTMTFTAEHYWPQHKSKAVEASDTPFELDFDLLPICDDATVRGTVVNAATGAPIVGADVIASSGQGTHTATNGSYTLDHLRVGTDNTPVGVTITVSADGFHPLRKSVTVFCNATLTLNFGGPPPPPSSIVVKKVTEPAGGSRAFTFTPSWTTGFDLADGGTKSFTGLVAGSGYSVAEDVPAGWELVSAVCSDGSPATNISLAAGETVTCTFTNRKLPDPGTIVVKKVTDPTPDSTSTSFGFTAGGGLDSTPFSLRDGETKSFTGLAAASGYSVAETVPAGWQQVGATCSDGSAPSSIDLAAGETVTCTFTNRRLPDPGTIVITKATQPAGSTLAFAFSRSWGAAFTLKDGETATFGGLPAGTGYVVSETVPDGWDQVSATCSDGSPVTNIDLAAGETVTCTFTNRQRATLIVRKQTQPDPDSTGTKFVFTAGGGLSPTTFDLANTDSRTFSNVVAGTAYSVAETVPAGWERISATCSDGSAVTRIGLAAGETVTCTFVNRRLGAQTGAHTIGFWQNKNGQAIIKGGPVSGGACGSATWLRQFKPFQDLAAKASCSQVAAYATNVIKAASSSGAAMNPMLKAQTLATALSVYFSDSALGGNKVVAPVPIGGVAMDLTSVCVVVDNSKGDGTCSGTYENVSAAFGGQSSVTVLQAITTASAQSNSGGSTWYGNVKATQTLAKDLFDAINNNVAFKAP